MSPVTSVVRNFFPVDRLLSKQFTTENAALGRVEFLLQRCRGRAFGDDGEFLLNFLPGLSFLPLLRINLC